MKIRVIASTKEGYVMSKEEAKIFSGKSAGICYLPKTVDELFSESVEKSIKRSEGTIADGHHSVFQHPTYNLILEGVPKILAIILNNEKVYNTSEKSGRYTKMEASDDEKVLYEKWYDIFFEKIKERYPNFEDAKIKKLSLENARYLISVFTPATDMEYSVNFCQLNYIISWMRDYIKDEPETAFSTKLKAVFEQFLEVMPDLEVDGLNPRMKNRSFSIFAKRDRAEEFGENYSVNYEASFVEFAQAERHRTLSYEMQLLDQPKYFVPYIIRGTELEEKWLNDISSLSDKFPQGMIVKVNERGTIENFALKCTERLCGAAQIEIMYQTKEILEKYMENVKDKKDLYDYLKPYSRGARCTFPGWKCNRPCVFGPKYGLDRDI